MGLFRRSKPPTPDTTTAVILAGGASSRFGAPKGLAMLQDRPLVSWGARLAAAVAGRTVLVLAPGADDDAWRRAAGAPPAGDPRASGFGVVHDDHAHQGPVAGVAAALPHLHTPHTLLLAVDMPLLRPDLVLGFHDRLISHDAIAYHLDGWWRPFPSLWRTQPLALAVQRALHRETHSLQALLDLVDARPLGGEFLALFDADASTLKSVNTPDELAAAARRLG